MHKISFFAALIYYFVHNSVLRPSQNNIRYICPLQTKMKVFKSIVTLLILPIIFGTTLFSCKKDSLLTDPSAKLSFSADTVMFDTVFTTVGSSTMSLMVYNTHNQKINISSITLGNGYNSAFRLNINGTPSRTTVNNIEIAANDSLFIFVEVTVNPNNKATPFIITDSIIFETNGNRQYVNLVAMGQNAHFFYPAKNSYFDTILPCNTVWNDSVMPYVIYGYLPVNSGCTFTINAGVKVYFHTNSGIVVLSGGTIKVNGTLGHEVYFQGDRLELDYRDVPGQWDGIYLTNLDPNNLQQPNFPGSKDCYFNYAIIKNGSIGIEADTVFDPTNTTLTLHNTIIENMSTAGLLAKGSKIIGDNLVVANCAQSCVALTIGGDYYFRHCTFANYWGYGTAQRSTPTLYLSNYYQDNNLVNHLRPLTGAYFGNCIVYGDIADELGLDSISGGFNYRFENLLLKYTKSIPGSNFTNLTLNSDPQFSDITNNNFRLSSSSPAIAKGDASITNIFPPLVFDIAGKNRLSGVTNPDLGAYQH